MHAKTSALFDKAALCGICLALLACSTPTTRQDTIAPNLTLQERRAQQALHVERVVNYQARVERIAMPLLKAALEFCEQRHSGYLGLRVDNIDAWPDEYSLVAKDVLQLDHALKVTQVSPDSPAAAAGVQVGDLLLSVNGQAALGGPGAVQDFAQLTAAAMRAGGSQVLALEVSRQGVVHQFNLLPEPVCDYSVHVLMHNAINAFADGNAIGITSGLIRFAENDEEIALVLAHEIAHNCMRHIEAKINNARLASVFDIVAAAYGVSTGGLFANLGARSFSKDFEREADYLGLYIMARAGMSLHKTDDFWRRMAAEDPASNKDSIFRTHPISAERTLALGQAIEEIEGKRSAGQPLLPERKP